MERPSSLSNTVSNVHQNGQPAISFSGAIGILSTEAGIRQEERSHRGVKVSLHG
jgi:hypothetical protein